MRAWIAILLFTAFPAQAEIPLDQWIAQETQVSLSRILKNISPQGAAPGTVLASPSGSAPDYRFHWTRDASLVMAQVLMQAPNAGLLSNFISLSRKEQLEPSAQGLGEPRFRVEGQADTLPWARPQYDGPALRALTLIRALPLTKVAMRGEALAAIRVDLDFVSHYWRRPCFDLWEEMKGLHFYTQSVQYAALLAGAELFDSQGEQALSQRLSLEAKQLAPVLEAYWDAKRGYIGASRELEIRPEEPAYKDENLDTAVILAALHAGVNQGILSFTDDRLLATAQALESAFAKEYAINAQAEGRAVAIGRFTDDRYFGGNPWFLTTLAFAELRYRVAQAIAAKGSLTLSARNRAFLHTALAVGTKVKVSSPQGKELLTALRKSGDEYIALARKYVGSQGEMSEQFDRDAGVPVSAYDLSWSYAAFLSAARARPSGRLR